MLSYLLNGYMTLFSVLAGITLNALCIYVFVRFRRNGSPVIQYYLVALTFWQTALLCNAFLLYCLPTLLYGHVVSTGNYVFLYPYAYAFANTTHTGSVWIILTLTVDRYLALCQPLTHRAIGKKSRVRRLMIAVSVIAILFSIPRFFEVTTVHYCTENGTHCEPTVARTAFTENTTYWTVYHIILAMLFVTLTPCLLLFALTLRISVALRHAIVRRRALVTGSGSGGFPPERDSTESYSSSKNITDREKETNESGEKVPSTSKKEHQANVMLVLVITKFLVSDVLPTVADVLEHLVGNQVFMSSPLATLFVDFSNFLLVLNCSTNFWLFFFWGRRFRRCCLLIVATSCVGRALRKWLTTLVDAAELSQAAGGPGGGVNNSSLTTTNYSKVSRSRCQSPTNGFGGVAAQSAYSSLHQKRSFAGFDAANREAARASATLFLAERKGYRQKMHGNAGEEAEEGAPPNIRRPMPRHAASFSYNTKSSYRQRFGAFENATPSLSVGPGGKEREAMLAAAYARPSPENGGEGGRSPNEPDRATAAEPPSLPPPPALAHRKASNSSGATSSASTTCLSAFRADGSTLSIGGPFRLHSQSHQHHYRNGRSPHGHVTGQPPLQRPKYSNDMSRDFQDFLLLSASDNHHRYGSYQVLLRDAIHTLSPSRKSSNVSVRSRSPRPPSVASTHYGHRLSAAEHDMASRRAKSYAGLEPMAVRSASALGTKRCAPQ